MNDRKESSVECVLRNNGGGGGKRHHKGMDLRNGPTPKAVQIIW